MGLALEEVDLPCLRAVGVAEAFLAQSTYRAVAVASPELDAPVSLDGHVASVRTEMLAGRADAVLFILAQRKGAYCIGGGRAMSGSIFFPRTLLEAVLGEKAGIALPELTIRHIGIDALLHEQLHVRFRMEAGIGGELGLLEYVRAKVLSGALNHGL